jgi:hypothetical protein
MFQQSRILFISVILAAVVYGCYAYIQPVYTYPKTDPRLDAHQYAAMYDYFAGNRTDYTAKAPFNTRILVPYLAAKLPFTDKIQAFRVLNGVFMVLTVLMLVLLWLRLKIRTPLIFLALFWVLFHWKGLVRMYLPDPVTGDVAGYFLLSLLLYWVVVIPDLQLGIQKLRISNPTHLIILSAICVLQKESFLIVFGVMFLVELLPLSRAAYRPAFFPCQEERENLTESKSGRGMLLIFGLMTFIAIVIYLIISYLYPSSVIGWRNIPFVTVFRVAYRYVQNPAIIPTIFTSWLLAYGLFVDELRMIKSRSLHISHVSFLTLTWFLLSIFGGGDTSRIAFNGMPIVLTFILLQLNKKPNWAAYFLTAASIPLMRLNRLEPDLGLHKSQTYDWCVECWTWADVWPWWVYVAIILAIYHYFLRRFATIIPDELHDVSPRSDV